MNRTINPQHPNSPANMHDGRSFTDYRPASYVDAMIANANQVQGSNAYRQFMIQNGLHFMKVNDRYIEDKMNVRECFNGPRPGSNFARKCVVNNHSMSCLDTNPGSNGIGLQITGEFEGSSSIQGWNPSEKVYNNLS